jgi:hypothetical protein
MVPRVLRASRPLGLAFCLALGACGAVDDASLMASSSSDFTPAASTHASGSQSLVPTPAASPGDVYVNEARGWSIVVPTGWELMENSIGDVALTRDQVIAEILVFPASGLTLEQLQAQKQDDLSAWQGAGLPEAQIVRIPAGEAVNITMEIAHPNGNPGVFVLYVIEKGEWQYVISLRGPQDDRVLADAEALAESFAIID